MIDLTEVNEVGRRGIVNGKWEEWGGWVHFWFARGESGYNYKMYSIQILALRRNIVEDFMCHAGQSVTWVTARN